MSHAANPAQSSRTRYLILAATLLVVLGLILWSVLRPGDPTRTEPSIEVSTNPSVSKLASPSPLEMGPAGTPATPSASGVASPGAASPTNAQQAVARAECTNVGAEFVPNRYSIERVGAERERVVALNLDSEGNIAAPPLNESRTASWWSGGPKPGASKGQAVLSIHTYRNDGAVGNDMYRGGRSKLQAGDIIKLYGKNGQVLCYEFTEAKKVWVKDYDPNSNLMVDHGGDPRLVIIICWDFDRPSEIWKSRVFFYAKPITV